MCPLPLATLPPLPFPSAGEKTKVSNGGVRAYMYILTAEARKGGKWMCVGGGGKVDSG